MALTKRAKYRYGDSQADIRAELLRYSKKNAYVVYHFADATCKCGGKLFRLAGHGTAPTGRARRTHRRGRPGQPIPAVLA